MVDPVPEKKKRGRKKQTTDIDIESIPLEKPAPKKRGRKPKGGKIIQNTTLITNDKEQEPNIILHLKCSLKDIGREFPDSFTYNPDIESIQNYGFEKAELNTFLIETQQLEYPNANKDTNDNGINGINGINENGSNDNGSNDIGSIDENTGKNDIKSIWNKLNSLKVNLHRNNISDKRSACFWCTYEFDNPPIYIPKNIFKDVHQVYGCFCTPECGAAYLMNEKIDASVKFERYQLMNNIYGKIYNYVKNIKPAPDPYHLLDKYYGNLTIKEYRQLFNTDQLLIVVDKPLTHVFPELYEDNADFILNQRTIPTSNIKLKRKSTVKNTNNSILENFGIHKNKPT